MSKWKFSFAALLACAMVACAPTSGDKSDPFESVNRATYAFNDTLDTYILAPVARGYVKAVPEFGRQRVSNVLRNLNMPWIMLNSTLQGDPENAMSAFTTFMLNSVFGVAGLFDFAGENSSLVVHDEDFGQTMGVWGTGPGAYVMLPIFGPSSVRDTFGLVVDTVLDPFNHINSDEFLIVRSVSSAIDTRAGLLDVTDDIKDTSFDPYATIRSGYQQHRKAAVANRK